MQQFYPMGLLILEQAFPLGASETFALVFFTKISPPLSAKAEVIFFSHFTVGEKETKS